METDKSATRKILLHKKIQKFQCIGIWKKREKAAKNEKDRKGKKKKKAVSDRPFCS